MFKNIGLAAANSPSGERLISEAIQLKNLFNSSLTILTVNNSDDFILNSIQKLKDSGLNTDNISIKNRSGEPATEILNEASISNFDLLIMGALEKETIVNYYIGSIARKIMRLATFSVLIYNTAKADSFTNLNIMVVTDFSDKSVKALKVAEKIAENKNSKIILLRELQLPGITSTYSDLGSFTESDKFKEKMLREEENKLNFFLLENEFNLKNLEKKCLYGKEGWVSTNFAKENDADLLIINSPDRRSKFIDRIFTHDFEFVIKDLPTHLLIID